MTIERTGQFLLWPLQQLVWHPERIAVVAGLLLVLGVGVTIARGRVAWPLVVVSLAWFVFSGWEWYCKVREYNIRVDLMLIWPVLLPLTAWGLIAGVMKSRRGKLPGDGS
jgi:uncharacterized membrane protein YphA (DoxX/SURF4 family)